MSAEARPATRIESFTAKDQSKIHIGDAYTVERDRCLEHLRITDPRHDRRRIERTAGGLLKDAYQWILSCDEYHQWSDDPETRLLWVSGGPGMGKTMLLSGIIDEIEQSRDTINLSFFFCQATDERINTATSVLRGLIYLLAKNQPSLTSHIKEKYSDAGKSLFEGPNAWDALFEILEAMLEDPAREKTILILDALDECIPGDLQTLLDLIIKTTSPSSSSRLKWIVSSRNEPAIEQRLRPGRSRVKLRLENNKEYVSRAVEVYTEHSISNLPIHNDEDLRAQIHDTIRQKADGRFLWASFVMRELREASQWNMRQVVDETPKGLTDMYHRMFRKIQQQQDDTPCIRVLLAVVKAYRPLCLDELRHMCGLPDEIANDLETVVQIVEACGSFLTIQAETVYITHQSAKDILLKVLFISKEGENRDCGATEGRGLVLGSERDQDRAMFLRSVKAMSSTLKRDIYGLRAPGYPVCRIKPPDPDLLAPIQYPCLYWIDHLVDYNSITDDLKAVNEFLRQSYLHWLESLSLLRCVSDGMRSMTKLELLIKRTNSEAATSNSELRTLANLAYDMCRFLQSFQPAIEQCPLQVYASALIFSPADSITKNLYKHEANSYMTLKTAVEDGWGMCIRVFEGHTASINAVTYLPDGCTVISASDDKTIRLWDTSTGSNIQTLKGHTDYITSIALSPDGRMVVSGSNDETVRVWNLRDNTCTNIYKHYTGSIRSVAFSLDGDLTVISQSGCMTIRLWKKDLCIYMRKATPNALVSPDCRMVATQVPFGDFSVWDISKGNNAREIRVNHTLSAVAFSPDGRKLVTASSSDNSIKVWDSKNTERLETRLDLYDYGSTDSIIISLDSSKILALSSLEGPRLLDIRSGLYLQKLQGHTGPVRSAAFSPDGCTMVTASDDKSLRLWNVAFGSSISVKRKGVKAWLRDLNPWPWMWVPKVNISRYPVVSTLISPNSQMAASIDGSDERAVHLWDLETGQRTHILDHHSSSTNTVAFSPNGYLIALGLNDGTVRLWEVASGKCLRVLEGQPDNPGRGGHWVQRVIFSPDGRLVASKSGGKVYLWCPDDGSCKGVFAASLEWTGPLVFSPDSRLVAFPQAGVDITVFNVDGDLHTKLNGHSSYVRTVVFSPDGRLVASGSGYTTARLWSLRDKSCIWVLVGHTKQVVSVEFSADGSALATGSKDGTVRVWNIHRRTCTSMFAISNILNFDQELPLPDEYIHTKTKIVALASSLEDASPEESWGYNLSQDRRWIVWNSEKALWLPPEFLPVSFDVAGARMILGCKSGKVLILDFAGNTEDRLIL